MATKILLVCVLACGVEVAAQSSEPGVVSAGKGNPYRVAATLPPRILNFAAQPGADIKPGQSVTLVWLAENPTRVTIDPEIGRVGARGSRQLTPKATTTYTLTVRGAGDTTLTKTLTVNVAGTKPVAPIVVESKREIPRTADGKPDLTGVYGLGPNANAIKDAAPSTEARGYFGAPAVLKAGAEKYRIVRAADDAGPTANCMPLIGPQAFGVPYQFQFVQHPHFVVLMHEYPGVFRIIPTDGSPHPVDPDPAWMGDARGHWEGETLVVDTIGFNDKTELSAFHHSEALHMVERFRRVDADTLHYDLTVEDPNVFEKPWTLSRDFVYRPEIMRIDEFVCENNRDYSKLFKK